jgi:hypothetical protein
LAANSNIQSAFGCSGVFLAMGEIGGHNSTLSSGSQTSTDSISLQFDPTQQPPGELEIGLFNGQGQGTSFSTMTFKIVANGVTVLNQTFFSSADATAFFTNHAIDLGSLASQITITETITTTTANSGWYGGFLLGEVPTSPAPLGVHASTGSPLLADDGQFDFSQSAAAQSGTTRSTPSVQANQDHLGLEQAVQPQADHSGALAHIAWAELHDLVSHYFATWHFTQGELV